MTSHNLELRLREEFGWRRISRDPVEFWFKGYLHHQNVDDVAKEFESVSRDEASVRLWLDSLDGHFALVARRPGVAVVACDPVCSIPMFFTRGRGKIIVDSHAGRLTAAEHLSEINRDGALAMAMAGYTIGSDTLLKDLDHLGAGECLIVDVAGARRVRYHRYEPWLADRADDEELRRDLEAVTLAILEKTIASAGGRQIVIPLSAGLDSRLIVSGLKHLGYANLRCFTYGLPGNYEARASEKVAAALGIPWRFHRYTPSAQGRFFAGGVHQRYLNYTDSCCSCPFVQDLGAVDALKRGGFIADDAILINGNTGDFISGNHVPVALTKVEPGLSPDRRYRRILDVHVEKHFRLWQGLATPENDEVIRARLTRALTDENLGLMAPERDFALAEFLEFGNRQSKYVISGERAYEFLGHEWRLPLWDRSYLDFWQRVPVSAKLNQRLYRDMLETANWGGVWGEGWRSRRYVSPAWMRFAVRPLFLALHAPLGRERWHAFERRYLGWWMDLWGAPAVVPYGVAFRDGRGARSFVSWHTEAYLRSKGIGWDGAPAEAREITGKILT